MADERTGAWVSCMTRLRREFDRLAYVRRFLLVRDSAYHRLLAADGIRRVSMALGAIADDLDEYVARWCDLSENVEKGGERHGGICAGSPRGCTHQPGPAGTGAGAGGAQACPIGDEPGRGGCASEEHGDG